MAAPLQTDPIAPPPYLRSEPSHREMRVRCASRDALLEALARARTEPWVEGWRVDRERCELVLQLAGGFHYAAGHAVH